MKYKIVSCSSNEKIGRIETKLTREVNKLLMDGNCKEEYL